MATSIINDPPVVDAGGPYVVDDGNLVTLTGVSTNPEGQPLTSAWDLDNNGTFETPGQSVSFTGVDDPSDHTVRGRATDNVGLTATA